MEVAKGGQPEGSSKESGYATSVLDKGIKGELFNELRSSA